MERLLLEDFRCFDGKRDVRLAPITILIGENSTGKTTFLASIRAAWDIAFGQGTPNFKEEPFDLGSFEQIANFRARKTGRSDSFGIGGTHHIDGRDITAWGTFSDEDSQPVLRSWTVRWEGHQVDFDIPAADSPRLSLSLNGHEVLAGEMERFPLFGAQTPLAWIIGWEIDSLYRRTSTPRNIDRVAIDQTCEVLRTIDDFVLPRPTAFAPIRSRPERTYDPRVAPQDSFGGHVPLALRHVLKSKTIPDRALKEALVSFGEASGLFNGLRVRNLRNPGDPFQIQVHNVGPDRNLIDVGYGVSQILPVMFDTVQGEPGQAFLFQQPEVHLHPKAQAEFASSIAGLVSHRGLQAVIETHSDFILDRLRIEARSGKKISPQDVKILYFERKGTSVKIHEIGLDDQANLTNVPPGFRDFFLREQRQLLGL